MQKTEIWGHAVRPMLGNPRSNGWEDKELWQVLSNYSRLVTVNYLSNSKVADILGCFQFIETMNEICPNILFSMDIVYNRVLLDKK